MKRTIVWLLALVMVTLVQAEEITSQQALQQAQRFLQERATAKNRAQKATPQLTMAKQVSGLYVFNMADNQGFVIVSNDDGVLPILGFSDSGHLDPDNMPTNMRAWLQGYADEIAWAREHKTFTVAKTSTAPAARRAGSHITAAIEPLMTTRWSQDSPFNDLCPEYASGHRCATGCVATAMAQVMRYHEWPQGATSAIPAYTTGSYGLSVSALPATTFDWDNMVDEYCRHWNGSYFVAIPSPTTAQATAVATLMQYCGSALGMDYGPESGANTDDVAKALRSYFDYNASTTQFVSRSFYTTAKWADLIYHELANKRPVVYGGTSSGGGHEFVCDGYKYESSTDFFHINWGWGGMSDDYFVLSALDPDAQGIGGSTSTDGYHFGQDAVIGIQKSTENGAVADITPNVVNLTLNSMTLSRNPGFCNMPVDITLNITNNSSDDYEGDVYVGKENSSGYSLLEGTFAAIPSGGTKDIVIPFTPASAGTYKLVLFLPNTIGSYSTNCVVHATLDVMADPTPTDVTITPATTSASVAWTGYADEYEVRYGKTAEGSETVSSWLQYDDGTYATNIGSGSSATWTWGVMYPGSQVKGNKLTKVSFYEVSEFIEGNVTISIYSGGGSAPGTLLYTTSVAPVNDNGFHEVTLPSPVTVTPWESVWITLTATGSFPMSMCNSSEANNQWVLNGSAWTNFGYDNYGWMIRGCIETASEEIDWKTVTSSTTSCQLTGLTPKTEYVVQVRGDFDGYGYTDWATKSFTTTDAAVLLGDVNNDGQVTITDAVGIVNYILGNPAKDFNEDAADVNGDGEITITDAVGVVNIILKGE